MVHPHSGWGFVERPVQFSGVCDEEKPEVMLKLAHSSVQDYILSNHFAQNSGFDLSADLSNTFLARSCIRYLLHFVDHPLDRTTIPNYPLAIYAAEHWCYHLLRCHDRTVLLADAMHLLQEGSKQYRAFQFACPHPRTHEMLPGETVSIRWHGPPSALPPIHLCALEGYIEGLRVLLENGADSNFRWQGVGLLQKASADGHTEIVRLLLEHGANVEVCWGGRANALALAVEEGHADTVTVLLANGADVNASGHNRQATSALEQASKKGHTDIVALLLSNGANVSSKDQKCQAGLQAALSEDHVRRVGRDIKAGRRESDTIGSPRRTTALQAASEKGHTDIVRLLLAHGAEVNLQSRGTDALHASIINHDKELMHLLLAKGANVNTHYPGYGTALQMVCTEGRIETVLVLLENGADVNIHGEYSFEFGYEPDITIRRSRGSALHAAAGRSDGITSVFPQGAADIVRLLLEKGANVDGQPEDDGGPLHVACVMRNIEIVNILIENGANVNATGTTYGPPLRAAAASGCIEIVRTLIDHGAEVNPPRSALYAAATGWFHPKAAKMVRLLLEEGAHVDGQPEDGGGPLHAACVTRNIQVVNILLENGAKVDVTGTAYGTPLLVAAAAGSTEIVRALIEYGADVNACGEFGYGYRYSSPKKRRGHGLQAALWNERNVPPEETEVLVRLLLENGANVDGHPEGEAGPLQIASLQGYTKLLHILLENGADVNATGAPYGTALHAAVAHNHTEIVHLLIDHGVKVDAHVEYHYNLVEDFKPCRGTALHAAAGSYASPAIVRLLLEKGASADGQPDDDGGPLHAACLKGNIKIVNILLENGANVNSTGTKYGTPLLSAAAGNHVEIVHVLIEYGADVNAYGAYQHNTYFRTWRRGTALQAAMRYGTTKIMHLLLEKGASINGQRDDDEELLAIASSHKWTSVVNALLENGADINTTNTVYGTALHAAVATGCTEIVRILIEHGADVNINAYIEGFYLKNGRRGTALQELAARYSGGPEATAIARLLIEQGATVDGQSGDDAGPLYMASLDGNAELVHILLENGANVNASVNRNGGIYGTALQAAALRGHVNVVTFLLESGANINASGGFYGNALQAASRRGYIKIVRLLLDKGADINALGGRFGTALGAASHGGHTKTVALLRGKGGIYTSWLEVDCDDEDVEK